MSILLPKPYTLWGLFKGFATTVRVTVCASVRGYRVHLSRSPMHASTYRL